MMNRCRCLTGALAGLLVLLTAGQSQATLVELTLIDADSIKPHQNHNYNSKSYIYSYESNAPVNKHVAYMKFDLSSIPDGSIINSIQLRMFTEIAFVTPGQPASIYRVANDNWSSTTNDVYPGTDELVGAPQAIINSFSSYNWNLDPKAFNPQTDLTDNKLSLGIVSPGYFNWFAMDGLNFSRYPVLAIDYSLGLRPGDATKDGYTDVADYTVWADHFLQTDATWEEGDFTGDGNVDIADYTVWADNFFPAPQPSLSVVPEPSSLALVMLGAAGLACSLRRQSR